MDKEDADSFAEITCGTGETISYDGTSWICISSTVEFTELSNIPTGLEDGDDDTLAILSCTEGQVPVYSEDDEGWMCGDVGSSGELATTNRIGESDGGLSFSNSDTIVPVDIPNNNQFGFTSTKNVPQPEIIETLSIDLQITHPDMGEVTVTLKSPSPNDTEIVTI